MKRPRPILLLILNSTSCQQQSKTLAESKVDIRVELMSIVFRLADSEEYSSRRFPKYINSIEAHFNAHKEHELISYIKETLRPKGVGFDAVMAMAVSITDTYLFEPLNPFSETAPQFERFYT